MSQNNNLRDISEYTSEYKCIYIHPYLESEIYVGTLKSIFSYSEFSLENLMFVNLNHEFCMCTDSTNFYKSTHPNLIATSIYRDYLHLTDIKDIVYGSAIIFGYIIDSNQNKEILTSVKEKYIEEIFQRLNNIKTNHASQKQ